MGLVLLVEYPEKIIDLLQVTDKLSHKVGAIEYTSPRAGFELTTLVVIGIDRIGSCKFNYHATTTTTQPPRNNFIFEY